MINWLRKQAAYYLIEKAKTPEGKESMELAGVDKEGRRYYTWPYLSALPMNRRKKLESIAIYADARISPENLNSLAHAINVVNIAAANEQDVKKKTAMHAKISQLCVEISEREKYSVPEIIHLGTASCVHVREDEPVNEFSEVIHAQKIETFRDEMKQGNAFFFKSSISSTLLNSSLGIDENLTMLLALWEQEESHVKERIKVISSYTGSESSTTQKMNG